MTLYPVASCVLQLAHLSSVRIIEHRNGEGALRSDRGINAGRFISILLDTFSSTIHVAEICVLSNISLYPNVPNVA